MNIRMIGVSPIVRCLTNIGIELCKRKGVNAYIAEGKRTVKRQKELYGKGRTVNECLKVMSKKDAKKYAKPNLSQVTWTMESNHIKGVAVDVVPCEPRRKNTLLIWNTNDKRYITISKVFKSLGFSWGGDWEYTKDYPHYEIKNLKPSFKTLSLTHYNSSILMAVQRKLKNKGYNVAVNAYFNKTTKNAIKSFKKANGLKCNAIITRKFLRKLFLS